MPGAGEVVVKVAAAALNFFDTLIIAGKYQIKPDFPFSPAAEFAGIVQSIGAGVTGWKPGDRVMGYSAYGAARECVRDQGRRGWCAMPDNLDFDRAAGLSVTYGTTIHALKDRAQAEAGRDARGARRRRRHRPRRDRDRQADGRARDRLRLVGREMRIRQNSTAPTRPSITARDDLRSELKTHRRRARHRRDLRSGRRPLCGTRARVRSPGKAAIW